MYDVLRFQLQKFEPEEFMKNTLPGLNTLPRPWAFWWSCRGWVGAGSGACTGTGRGRPETIGKKIQIIEEIFHFSKKHFFGIYAWCCASFLVPEILTSNNNRVNRHIKIVYGLFISAKVEIWPFKWFEKGVSSQPVLLNLFWIIEY